MPVLGKEADRNAWSGTERRHHTATAGFAWPPPPFFICLHTTEDRYLLDSYLLTSDFCGRWTIKIRLSLSAWWKEETGGPETTCWHSIWFISHSRFLALLLCSCWCCAWTESNVDVYITNYTMQFVRPAHHNATSMTALLQNAAPIFIISSIIL